MNVVNDVCRIIHDSGIDCFEVCVNYVDKKMPESCEC